MTNNIILIQLLGRLTQPDGYLCASYLEPITLQYLAAVLKKENFNVDIYTNDITEEKLIKLIEEKRPLAIGFSSYTYTFNDNLSLAKIAKDKAKQLGYTIFTVFGGYHPNALPEQVIAHQEVDFVIKGEGEKTFPELLSVLKGSKTDFPNIDGLFYKDNEKIIQTKPRQRIQDLDSLPWPQRMDKFLTNAKNYQLTFPPPSQQKSVVRVTYSRGCPFACSFCSSKNTWGQKTIWRNPRNVLDEIESLYKKYNTNLLSFLDLTFNASKEKVMDLCKEFIKRDLPIHWWGLFRADLLDKEMLEALAQAKCIKMNVGIETPDEDLAKTIKTSYHEKKDKTLKNLNIANDLGILIKAFLIIGFPEETKEKILGYPLKLQKFPVDELRITFATPLPGTQLFEEYISKNLIPKNPDWDQFTTEEPIINHENITKDEFLRVREDLVSTFYLSPAYKEHILNKIQKFPHLKEAFAEYFTFLQKNDIFKKNRVKFESLLNSVLTIKNKI